MIPLVIENGARNQKNTRIQSLLHRTYIKPRLGGPKVPPLGSSIVDADKCNLELFSGSDGRSTGGAPIDCECFDY